MTRRPTFEDMQTKKAAFIGLLPPPQMPKFTPASESEAVYKMMLDDLMSRIAENSRQALKE